MDNSAVKVTAISALVTATIGFPGAWVISRHSESAADSRQLAVFQADRQQAENEMIHRIGMLDASLKAMHVRQAAMESRHNNALMNLNGIIATCCRGRRDAREQPGRYSNAACGL